MVEDRISGEAVVNRSILPGWWRYVQQHSFAGLISFCTFIAQCFTGIYGFFVCRVGLSAKTGRVTYRNTRPLHVSITETSPGTHTVFAGLAGRDTILIQTDSSLFFRELLQRFTNIL